MKHADDNAYWTHPAHSTRVMHAHLTHVRKVWCTLECMNALQTVWMHIRHMLWRYDAHKSVWMHMRHLFVMQACLMCRWCALGRVHAYWWCTLDTPHRTFDCMNAHSTHVLKACSMCIIGSMFHAYHEHIMRIMRISRWRCALGLPVRAAAIASYGRLRRRASLGESDLPFHRFLLVNPINLEGNFGNFFSKNFCV